MNGWTHRQALKDTRTHLNIRKHGYVKTAQQVRFDIKKRLIIDSKVIFGSFLFYNCVHDMVTNSTFNVKKKA